MVFKCMGLLHDKTAGAASDGLFADTAYGSSARAQMLHGKLGIILQHQM